MHADRSVRRDDASLGAVRNGASFAFSNDYNPAQPMESNPNTRPLRFHPRHPRPNQFHASTTHASALISPNAQETFQEEAFSFRE